MNISMTLRTVGTCLGLHRYKVIESENKIGSKSFAEVYYKEIERRRGVVSNSTVENELTAYRSFLAFASDGIRINELTSETMMRYERWLRDRGVIPNTSACYMRSLRAVANRLGLDGNTLFQHVRTTKDKAVKKSLDVASVKIVKSAKFPENTYISLARDAFLFSIMSMGMPFVDMTHLKKSDIKDGIIIYHRRKTGRQVKVKIEPCMQEIIDRYHSDTSHYLFPFLSETDPAKAEKEYRRAISRYNRTLKRLSAVCGLNKKMSSYTARHTWATTALNSNIKLASISKALGHSSIVTTENYLKEIEDELLFEDNHMLLGGIFSNN